MMLLDYLAAHAPRPSQEQLYEWREREHLRAKNCDTYIVRSDFEIEAEYRYDWAEYMLDERTRRFRENHGN